ncbi:bifunctional serine/threonine-protein kinase/ABC transporter substrate-binding protein [Streptomyces millisiae]|uniref:Bifunctional serine/threonine-protein kinase/ABC transporter substrate-binding protein n=1 Tax=Streptomyces millisiae TaxID=3075542 RepID=A0ABU2LMY9_9ACTN|nr:bifunctional serine/threonine-protein kinase/ABC transporter substrate-binding protein [Streptomyces sp. DSM 44918]MDT0318597.1 bifunctional serine/threonine-protein kinase/ABC transporter substrate-binding protein [Streptomyces sp. DSM 44918]
MAELAGLADGDPRRVGRYRVLARLGAGGMGRVFLARSPGGRPVAVKVVRSELAEDAEFRRRFAREVAAARRVNSFFTAGVVDADPGGAPPWLATAYVAGLSLNEAISAHGPWPEPSVRALGAGLAEALEAIHATGLVHRDLKPSNVLLARDGPRVIDFGISLAMGATALTMPGAVVGTPGFIAPEQLRNGEAGPASDVFSLGAVLVYTASGTGPFGEGTAEEVNFRAAFEPPRLRDVPPGLRGLAGRCLEKEPRLRPSVAELLTALASDTGTSPLVAGEWLPAPVSHAVRERTETPLPTTPPAPTPSLPEAPPPPGTLGPAAPAGPPGRGPSRRALLTAAGGTAVVAGGGALAWRLARGGDTGGDTGGDGAAGERTVRIAVQGDLSGSNADIGREMLDAARLAVDQANASGDHPGLRLEVVEADDQGAEARAATAAQAAIDDGDVVAVVGPASYETVLAAGPRYSGAGLAFLVHSVTEAELAGQGFATLLRAVPDDRQSGTAIGEFLARHPAVFGATVIDNETSYGVAVANEVQAVLVNDQTHYLESRKSVASDETDLDGLVREITDSDADTVAFLGEVDQASALATALDAADFVGPRITGNRVLDQGFLDRAGQAAEGWFLASFVVDPFTDDATTEFAGRFDEAYGRQPGYFAARAYDVTRLVTEAVAGLDPEAVDRDTVFQALSRASHEGVTGVIRFGRDGEYGGSGPHLYQVTDGAFAPLGRIEEYGF